MINYDPQFTQATAFPADPQNVSFVTEFSRWCHKIQTCFRGQVVNALGRHVQ